MTIDRTVFVIHEIVSRTRSQINIYFCLERLQDRAFTVLQMSIFRPPFPARELEMARISLNEALFEMDATQYPWCSSLGEAIRRHDDDFGN